MAQRERRCARRARGGPTRSRHPPPRARPTGSPVDRPPERWSSALPQQAVRPTSPPSRRTLARRHLGGRVTTTEPASSRNGPDTTSRSRRPGRMTAAPAPQPRSRCPASGGRWSTMPCTSRGRSVMRKQLGTGEPGQAILIRTDLMQVDRVETGTDKAVDRGDDGFRSGGADHRLPDGVGPVSASAITSKSSGRASSVNTDARRRRSATRDGRWPARSPRRRRVTHGAERCRGRYRRSRDTCPPGAPGATAISPSAASPASRALRGPDAAT